MRLRRPAPEEEPSRDPDAIVAAWRESDPHVAVGLSTSASDRDLGLAPDRILQIGSITKVFTALVLAVEVVEGRLRLDRPVAELLPDGVRIGVPDLTLEELATHTSGLPRLPVGLLEVLLSRKSDPYADIDADRLHAALPRASARRRGRPAYSNLGFGLLGHALARHAGRSFGDLVFDRITGPLGMLDTAVEPVDPGRVLPGHKADGREYAEAWTFDAMAGAGALWSTVADLRVFLAAHRSARPDADDALARAMHLAMQPRVGTAPIRHGLGWIWMVGRSEDAGMMWHSGGTAGYRSMVSLHPDSGAGTIVLAASDRDIDPLALQLQRALQELER